MQPGGPSWPQVSGRSPCGAPVTVLFSSTSLSFPAHVPPPPPAQCVLSQVAHGLRPARPRCGFFQARYCSGLPFHSSLSYD